LPFSFFLVTVPTLSPSLFPVVNVCSYLISSQRSSLRPTLEDFDRTRSFHISEDQFLRVLTIFQLLSPGDKDAALLIKVHLQYNMMYTCVHMYVERQCFHR
jgi:hypothetical protein